MRSFAILVIVAACGGNDAATPDSNNTNPDSPPGTDAAPDGSTSNLPQLAFCQTVDPKDFSTSFVAATNGDAVAFTCTTLCTDWHQCVVTVQDAQGQPIPSARGGLPMQGLAFVVDGMAGH